MDKRFARRPDRDNKILVSAHHVALLVVGGARGDALFYVQAPRKLMEATLRELGHIYLCRFLPPCRADGRFFRFGGVIPKIEFAADEEKETVFKRDDERPAVELEERQACGKSGDHYDKRSGNEKRKYAPKNVACPGTAADVNELLEREGAEDFILDLNELRNLKLHGSSISAREARKCGCSRRRLSVRVIMYRFARTRNFARFVCF